MKTTVIALSAAALIAAAPAALAHDVSGKAPGPQHKLSKKHHANTRYYPFREMQGANRGYPGAFGYAPNERRDPLTDISKQAGGGGGGGGGGM